MGTGATEGGRKKQSPAVGKSGLGHSKQRSLHIVNGPHETRHDSRSSSSISCSSIHLRCCRLEREIAGDSLPLLYRSIAHATGLVGIANIVDTAEKLEDGWRQLKGWRRTTQRMHDREDRSAGTSIVSVGMVGKGRQGANLPCSTCCCQQRERPG